MSVNGKEFGPGSGEIRPEDREALRRRAQDLGSRLEEVKARNAPSPEERARRGAAMGQAMRIAAELVVGVAAGGFIGWLLDRTFGTAPWLLVLFLVFGFCAGLLNVVRAARRMQAEAEPLQRAAPAAKDDEDK
jgi:ATP synthase protein I